MVPPPFGTRSPRRAPGWSVNLDRRAGAARPGPEVEDASGQRCGRRARRGGAAGALRRIVGVGRGQAGTDASVRARQIIDAWTATADRPIQDVLADLRRQGLVTDALVRRAEEAFHGGRPGAYDLLTCGQNPLPHDDLGTPEISGGRGEVEVRGVYGSGPFALTYRFVGSGRGGRRLDHVACPAP